MRTRLSVTLFIKRPPCLFFFVLSQTTNRFENIHIYFVFTPLQLSTKTLFLGRLRLKCDGTHAETRFRLSAKRTSQFSRLLAAEVCASAVVMLDTPCSEVVWRVLATHSIRQFPFHFLSRASPCDMTFQLGSNKNWRGICPPLTTQDTPMSYSESPLRRLTTI